MIELNQLRQDKPDDYQYEVKRNRILGPAVKGTVTVDGMTKDFYLKLPSPAVHDDLRNSFYYEFNQHLPIPPRLMDQPYTERDVTVTYGFYSETEEFMNRFQAGRVALECGQVNQRHTFLTTADLRDGKPQESSLRNLPPSIHKLPGTLKKGKRWAKPGRLK